MRIAVVSDVHANLVALEAVIADLRQVSPDQVVCGGDLVVGGPRPEEVVARVRRLGWPVVRGNTDEVVSDDRSDQRVGGDVAIAVALTKAALAADTIAWLRELPLEWRGNEVGVVHSAPGDCWKVVGHEAPDVELEETYAPLAAPTAAYGHIHHPFVRRIGGLTVVNSGSVSLSLDGDVRATYAVIEDGRVTHRRVPYDTEAVAADLADAGYPATYVEWLRNGAWPSD